MTVAAPTPWQRLRKFVRRNRALSLAAGIAALALTTATVVLAVSLRIANEARQRVEQQQQELAGKADAGFRLLANEERLRAAGLAAGALPPPWPEHQDAYVRWWSAHGEPLQAELAKMSQMLAQLRARQTAAGTFADPVEQHLFDALGRLTDELQAFFSDGAGARLRGMQQLQQQLAAARARDHERWQRCAAAIKTSDGTTASRAYGGMTLRPQAGLVPLGIDARTGLAEFLDLGSHPRDADDVDRDALPADHGVVLVLLPPGSVRLGASRDEPGLPQYDPAAADDELGGESVWLDAFLIAKTELTVGQWARLMGRPAPTDGATMPITGVSWADASLALARFELELPTEAQWEYACRAGTTTPWSWGEHAGRAAGHAHYGDAPAPVGSLAANAFGLCDMHGNVAEWCRDEKVPYGQGKLRPHDGLRTVDTTHDQGPAVVRGGTFAQELLAMRSSARAARAPQTRSQDLGLRPVRRLR